MRKKERLFRKYERRRENIHVVEDGKEYTCRTFLDEERGKKNLFHIPTHDQSVQKKVLSTTSAEKIAGKLSLCSELQLFLFLKKL